MGIDPDTARPYVHEPAPCAILFMWSTAAFKCFRRLGPSIRSPPPRCKHHQSGRCRWGNACHFSHGTSPQAERSIFFFGCAIRFGDVSVRLHTLFRWLPVSPHTLPLPRPPSPKLFPGPNRHSARGCTCSTRQGRGSACRTGVQCLHLHLRACMQTFAHACAGACGAQTVCTAAFTGGAGHICAARCDTDCACYVAVHIHSACTAGGTSFCPDS